jgi:hypothetical protein
MAHVLLQPMSEWVDIAAQLKRVSGFSRIAGVLTAHLCKGSEIPGSVQLT